MGATDMFYRLFWCFSGNSSVSASQPTGSQNQGLAVAPPPGPTSCWCGFVNTASNMHRTTTRIGVDTAEMEGSTRNTHQFNHGYGGPAESADNDTERTRALVGDQPLVASIGHGAEVVGLVAHTPAKPRDQDETTQPRIGTGSTRAPGTSASSERVSSRASSAPLHGTTSSVAEAVLALETPDASREGVVEEGGLFSTPRAKSSAEATSTGVRFDESAEKTTPKDQRGGVPDTSGAEPGAPLL